MVNGTIPKGYHKQSMLTQDLTDKLVSLIRAGNYVETACQACGIHKANYYFWIREADATLALIDSDPSFVPSDTQLAEINFLNALQKAEAEAEVNTVNRMKELLDNPKNAIAPFIFAERRWPTRWGRRDESHIAVDVNQKITVSHIEVARPYAAPAIESPVTDADFKILTD